MQNTLWRCLHVRRNFERFVGLYLEKHGFETFVPFCQMDDLPLKDQPRKEVPLLPGFVFFKCDFVAQASVDAIPGVLAIVRGRESVSIVRTQEIEDLRRVVNSGIRCERWPFVPGRCVKVEDGPLRGITGIFTNTSGKRQLVLPISLVCCSVAIEFDDNWSLSQWDHANSVSS